MRKGCDLPCSDPFILSLKLIGVAWPAFYVAHQIVSGNNGDFPCCFIKKSKGMYVLGPSNQYHIFCLNSTKWQLARMGNPSIFLFKKFPGVRLTGIRHCSRFVNSKLPIFIWCNPVPVHCGDLKIEQRRSRSELIFCVCVLQARLALEYAVWYSAAGHRVAPR